MIPCINKYCESIMTDLYVGEKWICVCPVCGRENEHVRIGKTPTKADRLAGAAYAKAKNLEYDEAEKCFLESYRSSSDEDLKCGYIWWAVKCCFGVEYVEEILYPNDSEWREYQYVPIIARIPFNYNVGPDCDTLSEFEKYLQLHSYPSLVTLYGNMRALHTETAATLKDKQWEFDVFIAWHGKECKDFASGLYKYLSGKRKLAFFSEISLRGKAITLFDPSIYASLVSARVYVIVIKDYDALGKKFLLWEIRRMNRRRVLDSSLCVVLCGMQGATGAVPALLAGVQRRENCCNHNDSYEAAGNQVLSAFAHQPDPSMEKQKERTKKRRRTGKRPRTAVGKITIAASALAIIGAIAIGRGMLFSDESVFIPFSTSETASTSDTKSQYDEREYALSQLLVKDLEYTINDEGGITITKFTAADIKNILIPDVIDGRVVTVIGEGAFCESNITSVFIPASVKIVNRKAFKDCDKLETVTISEGVKELGDMAFGYCDKLRSLNIPASISTVYSTMIEQCPNLTELIVSENNTLLTVQNGLIIAHSKELLAAIGLPHQIEIPQGMESVWDSAFREQDNLSHVVIPEGVKVIQKNAFRYCDDLESVTLPASLETVGENIFADCPKLRWIYGRNEVARETAEKLGIVYVDLNESTLPSNLSWKANEEGGVTITGYMSASNEVLVIPAVIDEKPVTRIGTNAFKEKNITSVSIPGSVRVIESSAFWLCRQLEAITISEGVQELQYGAIGYCDKLRSVNIPSSIRSVDSIFINCPGLTELTVSNKNAQFAVQSGLLIENGTDLVGAAAVHEQLFIPKGVRTIRKNVFENQKNLIYIDIPEGIEDIQDEAFCACENLESITLPSSLESLGQRVFFDCPNLKCIYGRNSIARNLADELGVVYIDLNDSSLYNNFSWEINVVEGGMAITGYTGTDSENTIIPTVIDGKPVTVIGVDAFKETSVKRVTIPGSIKVIQQGAFWNCDRLEEVTVFEGVQEFEDGAFGYCDKLRSLNIPASISTFYPSMIEQCPNLTELTVSENNTWITVQNGLIITNNTELATVVGLPYQIEIPQGLETIGEDAFSEQDNLTHIDIPEGVTEIQEYAFGYCDNLESVTLPASFENLEEYIFVDCPKLKWIYGRNDTARKLAEKLGVMYVDLNDSTLPDNLDWEVNNEGSVTIIRYIGAGNEDVVIPTVIDGKPVTRIGEDAFVNATITGVSIPNSVKSIGVNAFWNCDNLKTVILLEGLFEINSGAFGECDQLDTLNIPSTVTQMGAAFIGCHKLENLTIAEGNDVISFENSFLIQNGNELLVCKESPEWLVVPQGIETVGQYAFMRQDDMIIAELPESVKEIQYQAFCSCKSLEIIIIPASDVTIGDEVFMECPNLKRIYGRNDAVRNLASELGVEYVNLDKSFSLEDLSWKINEEGGVTITGYKGTDDEHIVIPSVIDGRSITRIGLDAFKETSVIRVTIPGSIKVIEQGAFWNCDQLEEVTVFEGVQELQSGAFGYCDQLHSLSIPASVKSIGYIIANSPNLTELRISPDNPRISVQNGLLIADNKTVKGVVGLAAQVVIPSGIEFIGEEAFNSQYDLTHIDIPEGVKEIDNRAFIYCEHLESVSLPASLEVLGTDVFFSCPELKQISGKNNIARELAETLGIEYVDQNDSVQLNDLSWEINAEGGVTITEYHGNGVAEIVIPDQIRGKWVTTIGNLAFTNNHEIVSVVLGSNTTKIGSNSFENCSNLEKLVIPAPLDSFGTYALDRCKKLKTIVGDKGSKAPTLAKFFNADFVEN